MDLDMYTAFPTLHQSKDNFGEHYWTTEPGMDLRDYFAAKAMQAALTNNVNLIEDEQYTLLAKMAYKVADAMLKENYGNE